MNPKVIVLAIVCTVTLTGGLLAGLLARSSSTSSDSSAMQEFLTDLPVEDQATVIASLKLACADGVGCSAGYCDYLPDEAEDFSSVVPCPTGNGVFSFNEVLSGTTPELCFPDESGGEVEYEYEEDADMNAGGRRLFATPLHEMEYLREAILIEYDDVFHPERNEADITDPEYTELTGHTEARKLLTRRADAAHEEFHGRQLWNVGDTWKCSCKRGKKNKSTMFSECADKSNGPYGGERWRTGFFTANYSPTQYCADPCNGKCYCTYFEAGKKGDVEATVKGQRTCCVGQCGKHCTGSKAAAAIAIHDLCQAYIGSQKGWPAGNDCDDEGNHAMFSAASKLMECTKQGGGC